MRDSGKIPQWVEKLLERRQKYAEELSVVSSKVDEYCESLGIDLMDGSNSLLTDVSIYLEPGNALNNTRQAILEALKRRKGL